MTYRKLTEKEYETIIERLTERVIDMMAATAPAVFRKYASKKAIENYFMGDSANLPHMVASVSINMVQEIGDALVELGHIRRQNRRKKK